MKRISVLLALAVALLISPAQAEGGQSGVIRFGLTAAVVRENLDLYDRWAAYLGRQIGREVQFEQRRSYREAMELLEIGEHPFSWICSFPYAKYRGSKNIDLLAAPVFDGKPLYQAYIIVPRGSSVGSIGELSGKVFAYSDPDSNTGYVVPRGMLRKLGRNPDRFFRHTFMTYSHTETIEAVAEQVADGASVDSYVWEYLNKHQPELTAKTMIVQRSEFFGFPPLVARADVDPELRRRMAEALFSMDRDPEGKRLLEELMLDRFEPVKPDHYDNIAVDGGSP